MNKIKYLISSVAIYIIFVGIMFEAIKIIMVIAGIFVEDKIIIMISLLLVYILLLFKVLNINTSYNTI